MTISEEELTNGPAIAEISSAATYPFPLFRGHNFDVLDSGKRVDLPGGMVRDTAEDKIDYSLAFDGPMFKRYAEHLTKGAGKYEPRNWMKGEGKKVEQRFRESAVRHFVEWLEGKVDEDHAAAVMFNINGFEYVKEKNEGQGQ